MTVMKVSSALLSFMNVMSYSNLHVHLAITQLMDQSYCTILTLRVQFMICIVAYIDFQCLWTLRILLSFLLFFQDRCDPVMTAYKLVTVDAPYWGFGYRLEQALLAVTFFLTSDKIFSDIFPPCCIGKHNCLKSS